MAHLFSDAIGLKMLVHAPGGPLAAAVASFDVVADKEGSVALKWTASVDQAIVGGLEVYRAGEGPLPSPSVHVFKGVVPPAAAPSYSPLPYSALDLQAPAPEENAPTGRLKHPCGEQSPSPCTQSLLNTFRQQRAHNSTSASWGSQQHIVGTAGRCHLYDFAWKRLQWWGS